MLAARSPARPLALALAALLAAHLALAAPRAPRLRRQLDDDNALQPLDDAADAGDEQAREKRKLEGVTQAKFGIKNAVLGFVFGKINSLIDAKTRLVENLDRQNIEINKQYGIEAPSQNGLASISGIVGQVIGPKLQLLGPKIQAVTGLLGGSSGGGSGGSARTVAQPGTTWSRRPRSVPSSPPESLTSTTSLAARTRRSSSSSQSQSTSLSSNPSNNPSSISSARGSSRLRALRQARPTDDIPVFDRNKVSLDFPGSLFGPSVSLLIRATKVIGDVVQNSAVRYQSFLRLFRPLFRGPFEIKGLDPPTTTTTTTTPRTTTTSTTTTSTTAPPADNEVRRRRQLH